MRYVRAPAIVKMGHTCGVAHSPLSTMLHDTMISLIGITHRGMPEGIKCAVCAIHKKTHIENVVATINIVRIEQPNIKTLLWRICQAKHVFRYSLHCVASTIVLDRILSPLPTTKHTLVCSAPSFSLAAMSAPTIQKGMQHSRVGPRGGNFSKQQESTMNDGTDIARGAGEPNGNPKPPLEVVSETLNRVRPLLGLDKPHYLTLEVGFDLDQIILIEISYLLVCDCTENVISVNAIVLQLSQIVHGVTQ